MEWARAERVLEARREGMAAGGVAIGSGEAELFKAFHLLTAKPVLFICNVDEESAATGNAHSRTVIDHARGAGAEVLILAAAIEPALAPSDDAEARRGHPATLRPYAPAPPRGA